MTNDEEQEILNKRILARFRFKSLCRKVIANAFWLNSIEDKQIGTNPRRNIAIIIRRSAVKGILTLKEKSIFNTPHEYRNEKDIEQLTETIMSLKCFQMIPPKIRETMVQSCNFQFFNPGRVIIREGHHASAVYFVLDGEITVSKKMYSYGEGKWIDDVRYALVPGDMFGLDGMISGDKRTATCTTAINTEILCIFKEDLSPDVRQTLLLHWDNIKTALKRFDYYFGHFSEQQISECCTFSKIQQYNLDDIIYDGDTGQISTAYFVLSGQCMILQCLNMKLEIINNKKKYSLLGEKITDESKVSSQKHGNQANTKGKSSVHVHFGNTPKVQKNLNIEKYSKQLKEILFVDVATLSAGSIFGIGEEMVQRSIVAKNVVQCLEIPRFWLLERSQNIGNIWHRTKIFYLTTIPTRQDIFSDYERTSKWNQYKDNIIRELFDLYSKF